MLVVADRRLDLKNMMFARDARGLFCKQRGKFESIYTQQHRVNDEDEEKERTVVDCEKVLSCGKNTRSFVSPKPSFCAGYFRNVPCTRSLLPCLPLFRFCVLSEPVVDIFGERDAWKTRDFRTIKYKKYESVGE